MACNSFQSLSQGFICIEKLIEYELVPVLCALILDYALRCDLAGNYNIYVLTNYRKLHVKLATKVITGVSRLAFWPQMVDSIANDRVYFFGMGLLRSLNFEETVHLQRIC